MIVDYQLMNESIICITSLDQLGPGSTTQVCVKWTTPTTSSTHRSLTSAAKTGLGDSTWMLVGAGRAQIKALTTSSHTGLLSPSAWQTSAPTGSLKRWKRHDVSIRTAGHRCSRDMGKEGCWYTRAQRQSITCENVTRARPAGWRTYLTRMVEALNKKSSLDRGERSPSSGYSTHFLTSIHTPALLSTSKSVAMATTTAAKRGGCGRKRYVREKGIMSLETDRVDGHA